VPVPSPISSGLDGPFAYKDRYRALASELDGKSPDEAIEAIISDPERVAEYVQAPWRAELDKVMWAHEHPEGVARAIRGVIEDWPVPDRQLLRRVTAPTILVCVEGDEIHPVELGHILHDLLPNSELLVFSSQDELFSEIPTIVQKVAVFLASAA
jgi:pimeloyl-ACP methyl ester carboxylesterase